MRPLPGVSEDIRGAQAAVLHVNVGWLLVFVCNVNRSEYDRTLQQMLRLVARLNETGLGNSRNYKCL